MKRKCFILIVYLLLFNVFCSFFVLAENVEQPAVCGWPSNEMAMYFWFQNEMRSKLFNSQAGEKLLSIKNSGWMYFTNKTLNLPITALDLVASSVLWNKASQLSVAATSFVLMMLASVSTIRSSINIFALLVKDRPIVRDYREMMEIETKLFDVAFFRSQQLDLTRPINWSLLGDLREIIKKYTDLGLLEKWKQEIWEVSMADILSDLVFMNVAMRDFIVYWGTFWANILNEYKWCFSKAVDCNRNNFILKFDSNAVEKMKNDYSWIWAFWACNQYANRFKSTISKWINNNKTSVKVAMKDIEDANKRLVGALLGKWTSKKTVRNSCEDMSEYEMAQLKAYWWTEWECWNWETMPSMFSKTKESMSNFFKTIKTKVKSASKEGKDAMEIDVNGNTTAEKSEKWQGVFWKWVKYNPVFSENLYVDYENVYNWVMNEFEISQFNAAVSDLWIDLGRIKWLIDQVDDVSNKIWKPSERGLRKVLQDIADYQCSG